MTTEDVLFTYEVGRNSSSAVSNAELYRKISSITVKDDKTFILHLNKLTFDYAAINDFVLLPAHLERARFSDPARYRVRTGYDTEPTSPGLYNGPFRISEFVPGSHILLEPNLHWHGPQPQLRRVTVRIIENTAALEANLLSGTIDMVAGELGFPLEEAITFEKRHPDSFRILYKPSLVYEHIDCNLSVPTLADRRVRQALVLGLDREAISRQLFAGQEPVADGFLSPLDPGYTTSITQYRYEPERAAALLEAAGWIAQPKGPRIDANGNRLTLVLTSTAAIDRASSSSRFCRANGAGSVLKPGSGTSRRASCLARR